MNEPVLIGCVGCNQATWHRFAGTYYVGKHSGWRHLWRCATCRTTRVYGATQAKPQAAEEFALPPHFGEGMMCDSDLRLPVVKRQDLGLPPLEEGGQG